MLEDRITMLKENIQSLINRKNQDDSKIELLREENAHLLLKSQ